MCVDPTSTERINSFALVSYIPEPLSDFLDRLRQELVPNCFLRAHITILPPRPSKGSPDKDSQSILRGAQGFRPFDVTLNEVEVFPVSDVIHITVGQGERELRAMHAALNREGLEFAEPYPFHPHVTLAQGLKSDEVDELVRVARRRWAEFSFGRSFRVEKLCFVQATRYKTWIDLDECDLPPPPMTPRPPATPPIVQGKDSRVHRPS